jgi:L-ascorbate metabolism protein UlaG (beta-lactamase superfamily)
MDPGSFSTAQNDLKDIDLVLITHEHGDHLDMSSIKAIMANNPQAEIITNSSVQALLEKEGLKSEVLARGNTVTKKGITIEAIGEKHAILINSMPQIDNVGFLINSRFFYPGDALTEPGKEVEVLALPAAAPWARLSEIVDYALAVKPKIIFPVHDSILANPGMMYGMFAPLFENQGITFQPAELNKEYTF